MIGVSFVIVDRASGRPYVGRAYATEGEAERELASLLWPYPTDHEWCRRLFVRPCSADESMVLRTPGRPRIAVAEDEVWDVRD